MVKGVIAIVLLAAQCTAVPSAARPSASVSGAKPATCADRLKPGRHTLSFGGLKRRFLLSLPAGRGPHPVLLDLHGLGSSAAQQAAYSRLPEVASKRGYIVATPQAAEGRLGWTLPNTYGPDDTGFLGALLDHLEHGLCADRRREFAAGMSYGAGMATGLICALDGRLAGVAPVAGINIVQPCPEAEPTTIVAFHGTADGIVPYQGGHPLRDSSERLRALGDLITLPPVERVADGWARVLGCTGRTTSAFSATVRVRGWKACDAGVTMRLYTVKGGGHTWPGPIQVRRLGATDPSLDATEVILDAFDATPK
jgi:polyhydroxybutyrate depolymerase